MGILGNSEDFYSRVIAVTNRHLCDRPYLEQIERICRRHPGAVIVREKDMGPEDYELLYRQVREICQAYVKSSYLSLHQR